MPAEELSVETSPNKHWLTFAACPTRAKASLAWQCIFFLVPFGEVARGSVRNSCRLRLRPLQPFLSGLLLGF
jgi:hypothetical protein